MTDHASIPQKVNRERTQGAKGSKWRNRANAHAPEPSWSIARATKTSHKSTPMLMQLQMHLPSRVQIVLWCGSDVCVPDTRPWVPEPGPSPRLQQKSVATIVSTAKGFFRSGPTFEGADGRGHRVFRRIPVIVATRDLLLADRSWMWSAHGGACQLGDWRVGVG